MTRHDTATTVQWSRASPTATPPTSPSQVYPIQADRSLPRDAIPSTFTIHTEQRMFESLESRQFLSATLTGDTSTTNTAPTATTVDATARKSTVKDESPQKYIVVTLETVLVESIVF
jgi:hypothetical protein